MKLLPQKSQLLTPFKELVSDSNDKKVFSNPIVLLFGGLVALVILGDIFSSILDIKPLDSLCFDS